MPGWTVAIETVATAGSVALIGPDNSVNEFVLPPESRSARTLAAAVQQLWHAAGRPPIELVAVAHGPGSFTGLRVGVMTAKALAYAWRAQLIGINTLDAIAAQVEMGSARQLHVVLEAQRQELFVAKFQALANGRWERSGPDEIVAVQDWLTSLQTAESTAVAGPALKKLREKLPLTGFVADEAAWHPRAATVARCGREKQTSGAPDELWTLLPQYLRASYAEEKRQVPCKE